MTHKQFRNTPLSSSIPSVKLLISLLALLGLLIASGPLRAETNPPPASPIKQQADSLFNAAERQESAGNFGDALILLEKSLPLYQRLNQPKDIGKNLKRIATVFYYQGNYAKALLFFERSKGFYQQADDKKGISSVLNNMGAVHYYLGNKLKALDLYKQAIQVQHQIGDRSIIASTTQNIGGIYVSIKDYQNALVYYKKAYLVHRDLKDSASQAQALNGIGEIYMKQQKYPEAAQYLNQSLTLANRLGNKMKQTEVLYSLGGLYGQQMKPVEALSYYNQSLDIALEIKNLQYVGNSTLGMGSLLAKTGKNTQAIKFCQEGLGIAEKLGSVTLKQEACECLYTAYKSLGNTVQALNFYERSIAYKDSLQSQEIAQQAQNMEFRKQQLADSSAHAQKEFIIEQHHKEEVREKERQRNLIIVSLGFILLIALALWNRLSYVRKSKAILQKEKDRSENLLLNILPKEIAEELKEKGWVEAQDYSSVAILFSDFKSFTQTAAKMSPQRLVEEINTCFKAFDQISEKYSIEKIKTIGDAYMAAGGLPNPAQDSTRNIVLAALDMQAFIAQRKVENERSGKLAFEMRIGIHSGPVVAGIVGVKKFQYDLWGDTVNTASRVESHGEPGKVNVSEAIFHLLKEDDDFTFEGRGSINAKGKGEIQMYFVEKKQVETPHDESKKYALNESDNARP